MPGPDLCGSLCQDLLLIPHFSQAQANIIIIMNMVVNVLNDGDDDGEGNDDNEYFDDGDVNEGMMSMMVMMTTSLPSLLPTRPLPSLRRDGLAPHRSQGGTQTDKHLGTLVS